MYYRLGKVAQGITKRIDIFGSRASLYISGAPSYKTSTGGCFSVIYVFAIISFIYYQVSALLDKKTFTYTFTESFIEDPKQLNVTNPTFYFAVMILVNSTFMNASQGTYFDVVFEQVICPAHAEYCNVTELGTEVCNQNMFPTYPDFEEYVDGGFCPINETFIFYGQPLGDLYNDVASNYLSIKVTNCSKTTNSNCIDTDYEQLFLNTDFSVFVFYTNNFVDVNNYADPLQQMVGYAGGPISPGFIEMVFTEYLDELKITTYEGYLTETPNTNESYTLDPLSEVVYGHAPTQYNNFFSMNIRRSQLGSVYVRRYMSLTTVMSDIGGLAIALKNIIAVVVSAYAGMKYKVFFTNSVYMFKGIMKKKDWKKMQTMDTSHNSSTDKEAALIALNGSSKIGEFLMKSANPKVAATARINANFWDFIKFNMPCGFRKTDRGRLIAKSAENIIKDTDIFEIVRAFREVERLEEVVLNKEETLIFESMHDPFSKELARKPTVVWTGDKFYKDFDVKDPFFKNMKFSELEAIFELYRAWYTVHTKEEKTYKEQKLMDMMDAEILEQFMLIKSIIGDKLDMLPLLMVKSIKRLKQSMEIPK